MSMTSSVEDAELVPDIVTEETSLSVKDLSLFYGQKQALANINMGIATRKVTAFIGPSGCGKSTLLRCFNRMNDLIDDVSITGDIEFEKRSIYENVAYGLRLQGETAKAIIDERVEWALKSAALWEEVKDRLKDSALGLSGGQQQRLVIARAIAIRPSVLLLDEPASALDPISTLKIEELIHQLKDDYTIAIVTHNMQQAARVSDYTAFLYLGELIEFGTTDKIFRNPDEKQTEDYITGRYG